MWSKVRLLGRSVSGEGYTGGACLAFFENLEGKAAAESKAAAVPPPPSGPRLPEAGSARVRASGEEFSGGASHARRPAKPSGALPGTAGGPPAHQPRPTNQRTIPDYPRDKAPVRVIRRGLNQEFREMLVALQGEGAAFLRMVDL